MYRIKRICFLMILCFGVSILGTSQMAFAFGNFRGNIALADTQDEKIDKPEVKTRYPLNIGSDSVTLVGEITSSGGGRITEHGFQWGEEGTLNRNLRFGVFGNRTGRFQFDIRGLEPLTVYYYRSVAVNEMGTVYGETKSFKTGSYMQPSIRTYDAENVLSTTATLKGEIINRYENKIVNYGFLLGEDRDNITRPFSLGGAQENRRRISTDVSGLKGETRYYYRLYVATADQWVYGNVKSFVTCDDTAKPYVTTGTAGKVTPTTAELTGNLKSHGGYLVESLGFQYGLDRDKLTKRVMIRGKEYESGDISAAVSGLRGDTKYYFRSFAKNSNGEAYGDIHSFKTEEYIKAQVVTYDAVDIDSSSAVLLGGIHKGEEMGITDYGFQYGESVDGLNIRKSLGQLGSRKGVFRGEIKNLKPLTRYYYRAYAVNKRGEEHGRVFHFTTGKGGNKVDDEEEWEEEPNNSGDGIDAYGISQEIEVQMGRVSYIEGYLRSSDDISWVALRVEDWYGDPAGCYREDNMKDSTARTYTLRKLPIDTKSPPFSIAGIHKVQVWAKRRYSSKKVLVGTVRVKVVDDKKVEADEDGARENLRELSRKHPDIFAYFIGSRDEEEGLDSSIQRALYDFREKYGLLEKAYSYEQLYRMLHEAVRGEIIMPCATDDVLRDNLMKVSEMYPGIFRFPLDLNGADEDHMIRALREFTEICNLSKVGRTNQEVAYYLDKVARGQVKLDVRYRIEAAGEDWIWKSGVIRTKGEITLRLGRWVNGRYHKIEEPVRFTLDEESQGIIINSQLKIGDVKTEESMVIEASMDGKKIYGEKLIVVAEPEKYRMRTAEDLHGFHKSDIFMIGDKEYQMYRKDYIDGISEYVYFEKDSGAIIKEGTVRDKLEIIRMVNSEEFEDMIGRWEEDSKKLGDMVFNSYTRKRAGYGGHMIIYDHETYESYMNSWGDNLKKTVEDLMNGDGSNLDRAFTGVMDIEIPYTLWQLNQGFRALRDTPKWGDSRKFKNAMNLMDETLWCVDRWNRTFRYVEDVMTPLMPEGFREEFHIADIEELGREEYHNQDSRVDIGGRGVYHEKIRKALDHISPENLLKRQSLMIETLEFFADLQQDREAFTIFMDKFHEKVAGTSSVEVAIKMALDDLDNSSIAHRWEEFLEDRRYQEIKVQTIMKLMMHSSEYYRMVFQN